MKYILYKKFLIVGIIILLFVTAFNIGNVHGIDINNREEQSQFKIITRNDILLDIHDKYISNKFASETEYWALLFAVGEYKNHPHQNRPSMLKAVEDLYEVLIDSPQWQEDHIHKVTASDATGVRLIQELIWLIQNVDDDDQVIVYLTTHGSKLKDSQGNPKDLPPKDETDGADEMLVMYGGFDNKYGFIWDDLLNYFLGKLKSKGICLIVDSCYSGGFNDESFGLDNYNSIHISNEVEREKKVWSSSSNIKSLMKNILINLCKKLITNSVNKIDGSSKNGIVANFVLKDDTYNKKETDFFTRDFIEDIKGEGRIVLMSCEEDKLSYGSRFSNYLIDGFWGLADGFGNGDGINSAEESFAYADWWVNIISGGSQNPTILDNFPGEFTVTYT